MNFINDLGKMLKSYFPWVHHYIKYRRGVAQELQKYYTQNKIKIQGAKFESKII